eukprot:TRINITY_DN18239_c0_g1_i1.p1 TRINITY_DN18239_c0_g1~~TRINITY_DN18239_c0_g1_i1.p1  ORF type:complete len:567 (+),score=195.61 TRINITY_DN18239_c0_g1_i1:73-1701(+)
MSSPPPGSPRLGSEMAELPVQVSPARLSQPLLPPADEGHAGLRGKNTEQTLRSVTALQRCVGHLVRKVGHQKEDKHFDRMMQMKDTQITLFSMAGLVAMVVLDAAPWYMGDSLSSDGRRVDTLYKDGDDDLKTTMLASQLVCTLTTGIVLLLIVQYYTMELARKRREWSGLDLHGEPVYQETAEEKRRRLHDQDKFIQSYSFWGVGVMKWHFIAEIAIHVVHPVFVLQEQKAIYEVCKVWMFFRLYTLVRAMHKHSRAYKNRFEIISSIPSFRQQSLRISPDYTIKILFDHRTVLTISVFSLLTCVLGGFGMFLVERNADVDEPWAFDPIDWAGDLGVAIWFAYVTSTTIGYGDFWPATFPGRITTVLIALVGIGVTTIFQAIITNNLKSDKNEKYIREYIDIRQQHDEYQIAGVVFIQRVWRLHRAVRDLARKDQKPIFHMSNIIFSAVREFRRARMRLMQARLSANDHVLEGELDTLAKDADEIGWEMQAHQDEMITLHRRVGRRLREIRKTLRERGKEGLQSVSHNLYQSTRKPGRRPQ